MKTRNNTAERIVAAAVRLFAKQGFSGTSTREIAGLAEVNETSLFRHFQCKQDLFWAALESQMRNLSFRTELQRSLAEDDKPEIVLPLIVEFLVESTVQRPDLLRLLCVGLLELRPDAELLYRQELGPLLQVISEYVSRCVKAGVIRRLDPGLITVALTTAIVVHQGLSPLLMGSSAPYATTEEAVAAYTEFCLNALMPNTCAAGAAG